jgi:hypothetical protein
MKQPETKVVTDIETRRDEEVTLRLVIQAWFRPENPGWEWHYYLNGVEITLQQHTGMKLPF